MWIPTIKSAEASQGNTRVLVSFTNGTDTCEQYFTPSDLTSLKVQVQNKADQLNNAYAVVQSLSKGSFDTSIMAAVLTAPQIAQNTFMTDYQLLQSMNRAIAAGIKTATDSDYVAQLSKVKSEYLPAYLALI